MLEHLASMIGHVTMLVLQSRLLLRWELMEQDVPISIGAFRNVTMVKLRLLLILVQEAITLCSLFLFFL
jgi:hypothetical protein